MKIAIFLGFGYGTTIDACDVERGNPGVGGTQDKSSRIELYVQEWEKRRVPLDDYQDWMTVGMALASAGEECREFFHRISVFSSKYDLATVPMI